MSPSIHPDTMIGPVSLTASNMDGSLAFYQQVIGFKLQRREGSIAYLGAGEPPHGQSSSLPLSGRRQAPPLLVLTERPGARRTHGTTGLYHFAILVPSRLELARSLRHLAETRTPVQGFSDHLVSEAIYLADPDGNGIEIYRDRPRTEWSAAGGQLHMDTRPLDVGSVLAELEGHGEPWTGLPPQTVIGHIHLHVADLRHAEAFYRDVLGFDLMMRYGPSAAFLSAGGYHHHIGCNAWTGEGASPPPPDAVGLKWYVVCLPNPAELGKVVDRVRNAGLPLQEREEGFLVHDPAQNGVMVSVRP